MAARLLLASQSVYIKVEIDFTSNWNASSSFSFTDVTADVRFQDGVAWDRGKNAAWDSLAPGSFSFTLNNRAGTYDPASNSDMVGSRLCRITLYYPTISTAYVQFFGVIDSFEDSYPILGKDAVVNVSGVDWLTSLWLAKVVTFSALATSSTSQYKAICNAANIPAAYQSFTTGTYTLKPAAFQSTDCLSALGAVANSQRQFLYVSKTGILTSVDLAAGSVSHTYSDQSTTYPYTDVRGGVGGTGTYTIVQLQQPNSIQVQGGTNNNPVQTNIPGSPLPKTKFGPQVLEINSAPVTVPTTLATAWAAAVPSPATYWWREVEFKPFAMKATAAATLIPALLGTELGDRITVVRHPLQGGSVSKSVSVRSVKYDIRGADFTVTFGLTNR